MFYEIKDNILILNIKVIPNSNINKVVGILNRALKIKLSAQAINGEANKALIKLLSKEFKISKNKIKINSGKNSKNKIIYLQENSKTLQTILSSYS